MSSTESSSSNCNDSGIAAGGSRTALKRTDVPGQDTASRKRARIDPDPDPQPATHPPTLDERAVGIEEYVDAAARPAFHAIIKQRFSDFQVFEADVDGTIQHITDLGPPRHQPTPSALEARIQRDRSREQGAADPSSATSASGSASVTAPAPAPAPAAPTPRRDEKPYLHFLLQKTNRDNHEALALLSRALRLPAGSGARSANGRGGGRGGRGGSGGGRDQGGPSHDLAVAGTKDRRAVTVQRVSLLRRGKTAEHVWALANGCETDFDSDLPRAEAGEGSRGRGARGGGRGRGRAGRGRSRDEPWRTYLDAFKLRGPKGLRVAHITYADHPFRLGDLSGNEFLITLRNVKLLGEEDGADKSEEGEQQAPSFEREEKVIAQAMTVLQERGFINYYGMQRFGTTNVSTHEFGIPLFKADYKRAIELLLNPRTTPTSHAPQSGIEADAARARTLYAQGDLQAALDAMPRSYGAERAVLGRLQREEQRHGWNRLPRDEEGMEERRLLKRDWLTAFAAIPKTMRMMYVHAYQSFIWNKMVSERVRRHGLDRPVVGDYVYVEADDGGKREGEEPGEPVAQEEEPEEEEEADEEDDEDAMFNQAGGPSALKSALSTDKGAKPAVKVLTEADVHEHTIADVIMPLPGSEVTFEPGSWLDGLYRSLLARDGLTPEDVGSSNQPEYALRGAYRKILHTPRALAYTLLRYTDPHLDLALSDEDALLPRPNSNTTTTTNNNNDNNNNGAGAGASVGAGETDTRAAPPRSEPGRGGDGGRFLALQLRLTLGTSAYATMALREVLKTETSSAAQRALTLQSEDQAFVGSGSGSGKGKGKGVEAEAEAEVEATAPAVAAASSNGTDAAAAAAVAASSAAAEPAPAGGVP